MGKLKIYLLVGGLLVIILSTYICYCAGWASGLTEAGKQTGYMVGLREAKSIRDEKAFMEGSNSGIKEIVQSECNPGSENQSFRKITKDDLDAFLKSDKTDELNFTDNITTSGYAFTLKKNANKLDIDCAIVILHYQNEITGKYDSGYIINAFKYVSTSKNYYQNKDGTWAIKDVENENTVFVDPKSDKILTYYSAADLVGKPYHLCLPYYLQCRYSGPFKVSVNAYGVIDTTCMWYYQEMYGTRKVEDKIIKVDLIW